MRWKQPADASERRQRFLLPEDRGDRVLVSDVALQSLDIVPTHVYAKADLEEHLDCACGPDGCSHCKAYTEALR